MTDKIVDWNSEPSGYINADGVAIYYDQLPKIVKDEVKKND